MLFNTQVLSQLHEAVNAACSDQKMGISGATVVVIGKDGNELFAYSAGKRGVVTSELITLDNIYWIASFTKILMGLICMQLVE